MTNRHRSVLNLGALTQAMAGFEQDYFGFQPQDPRTQHLLVISQRATLLALGVQFLLQRSNPTHEVSFVETQ